MSAPDYRCYFVTGNPEGLVSRCLAVARGGAGIIQVRSKPITARDLYQLTREIATAIADAGLPTKVLVNDRVDVALALMSEGVPVHGVHVGQDDLPVKQVRALLGSEAIIGLTTGTMELVQRANELAEFIDYIGCGPFRATPTKQSGRTPLGLEGYVPIVAASALPVVAIGDITVDDAPALASTGVSGVAVVRALMNAADPERYAADILAAFDAGSSTDSPTDCHGGGRE